MKKSVIIILALSLANAAAGGCYVINISGKTKNISHNIELEKAALEKNIRTRNNLVSQNKIKAELTPSQKAQINGVFPDDADIENIFVQLNQIVSRNGAMFKSLDIGSDESPRLQMTQMEEEGLQANQQNNSNDDVSEFMFSIEILGTYPSIKSVIRDVEINERIMDVMGAELARENENSQTGEEISPSRILLIGKIKIKTYYKNNKSKNNSKAEFKD